MYRPDNLSDVRPGQLLAILDHGKDLKKVNSILILTEVKRTEHENCIISHTNIRRDAYSGWTADYMTRHSFPMADINGINRYARWLELEDVEMLGIPLYVYKYDLSFYEVHRSTHDKDNFLVEF